MRERRLELANIATEASTALRELLESRDGLGGGGALAAAQILAQNVGAELMDRAAGAKYPQVCVYCERIVNDQREKFPRFSGTARLVAEIRVSQEHLEGLEVRTLVCVDEVTAVLGRNRGEWREGLYFGGRYEVEIEGVRRGGRNFLQVAKVKVEVAGRR